MPVYLGNEVSLHQTLAPCRHFQYRIGSDSSFPTGSDSPTDDSIRQPKQCINPPVWNEDSEWDLHRTKTLNRPDPHANYPLVRATPYRTESGCRTPGALWLASLYSDRLCRG